MSWQRIILGDWNPVVRDPLDVMRLAFFGGAAYYAANGETVAVGLAAASTLLLLARLVDLPRPFDLALILALTMIAWGTALDLYGRFFFYDNIVHALAPLCYAPVLYVLFIRLGMLPDLSDDHERHHHLGVFLVTLAIGMAVTGTYEVVEWLSDSIAGTHFVKSVDDTGSDLTAGLAGSAVGAALLVLWAVAGFATTRRMPGDALSRVLELRAASSRFLEGGRARVANDDR